MMSGHFNSPNTEEDDVQRSGKMSQKMNDD